MKLKKKAKMMIVLSIIANLLSGCGFGETKIEYERLVKALDEGDMKTVMSASDGGYAYVKKRLGIARFGRKMIIALALYIKQQEEYTILKKSSMEQLCKKLLVH